MVMIRDEKPRRHNQGIGVMTRFVRQYRDLILTGALALVFAAWPNLDWALVSYFLPAGRWFPRRPDIVGQFHL
jgi:hypothetical protein